MILLYMRSTEGTLRFRLNWLGFMKTELEQGEAPQAIIPEASELALCDRKEGERPRDESRTTSHSSTSRPPRTSSAAAAWATRQPPG